MNIEKKKLFETLGIKNGPEYVKEVIEHRRIKIKDSTNRIPINKSDQDQIKLLIPNKTKKAKIKLMM